MPSDDRQEMVQSSRQHIARRTAQLPVVSRALYRVDHYSSTPAAAISAAAFLVAMLVLGAVLGFPTGWIAGFEVGVASVTLLMVFAIQHTQSREQAATQRKLDELLLAMPGAAESLMMLEEAPREVMLRVEDDQRGARSDSVEGDRPIERAPSNGTKGSSPSPRSMRRDEVVSPAPPSTRASPPSVGAPR